MSSPTQPSNSSSSSIETVSYDDGVRIASSSSSSSNTASPPNRTMASCWNFTCSTRFAVTLMCMFALAAKDMVSSNLSMAIICMVNITLSNSSDHLRCDVGDNESVPHYHGKLDWNTARQGILFSSFDWGLMLILFTGFIVDMWSPKLLAFISTLVAAITTFLTPVIAQASFEATVVVRVILGACNAVLNPAVNKLISTWIPKSERNTAYAVASCGDQLSTILILPLSGVFCSLYWLSGGWPLIFYFTGVCNIIVLVCWFIYITDDPAIHKWIPRRELEYIEQEKVKEDAEDYHKRKVPLRKIISSSAVWATVSGTVGHEFPLIMYTLYLPTYLKIVLGYPVTENGWISALPKVAFVIVKLVASNFSDYLLQRHNFSPTTLCKVFNSIAALGLGGFMLATTLLKDCSQRPLATAFLILSQAFSGFNIPGALVTLVSIAPPYTGTICGLAYGLTALLSIIAPIVIGHVVIDNLKSEWDLVFYVISAFAFAPLITFNIWGSADVQPWARHNSETDSLKSNSRTRENTGPTETNRI